MYVGFDKLKDLYKPKGFNKKGLDLYKPKGLHFSTLKKIQDAYFVYYRSRIKPGKGVGKNDHIVKYFNHVSKKNSNLLNYNKPCVCGSLTHRRPNHRDCPVNDQYNNAVET